MTEIPGVQTSCLPTDFAISMAQSVKLYDGDPEFDKPFSDHKRLELFQSISVSSSLEESIAASYFGLEISEEQQVILRVIHQLTTKWLIGNMTQSLIDRLDLLTSLQTKGRDVADITEKIMELMGISVTGEGQEKSASKMVLEHTVAEDNVTSINEGKKNTERGE